MEENTTALALPDEQQFKRDIQAINRFQQVVHANMVKGHDFGIIPGTQKPTLLKPGAEKIAKLLGLSDQYEIMDQQEDWQAGFFRYLVKCLLVHINTGAVISEGLGECNSMESKYRFRWAFASELPSHLQGDDAKSERDKLTSKMVNTRNGKAKMYRVDNEDIFSQVNTILKMAKKRALVDASLSAGRLSDVFTQDIEDMGELTREEPVAEQPKNKATEPIAEENGGDKTELINLTIKNLGALFSACLKHFGMNQSDVLKELGGITKEQIADVQDAWRQIVEAKT